MSPSVTVAIISASAAIIVAAISYFATKQREREAEWRKEKFIHYKDYFSALASDVGVHSNPETSKNYAIAFNTVGLFASQDVIICLHKYQDLTRLPSEQVPLDEHDKLLTSLVLAIRKDLKLKPDDDTNTFSFKLIESAS